MRLPNDDDVFSEIGRDPPEVIASQRKRVAITPAIDLFEDFPIAIFVLNERRQIVFVNKPGRDFLPDGKKDPYGLRPGEAFSCVHAEEGDDGCGTGQFCRYCGALKSIRSALMSGVGTEECHLERIGLDQVDLLVWSKQLPVDGEVFLLFSVIDISSEKRRESFEHLFLHDLMNTAGSLSSLLRLLDPLDASFSEYLELAQGAADQLTDEILSHRVLSEAEEGILSAERESISLVDSISSVADTYRRIAESRGIGFDLGEVPHVVMTTDPILLKRVLANLLKNAVEACARGERVSLFCSVSNGIVEFVIQNPAVMSDVVKANLFRRSFSTKGRGHGLGTYSARLFVEEYLGGSIKCDSEQKRGTVFTVRLPLSTRGEPPAS